MFDDVVFVVVGAVNPAGGGGTPMLPIRFGAAVRNCSMPEQPRHEKHIIQKIFGIENFSYSNHTLLDLHNSIKSSRVRHHLHHIRILHLRQ